MASNMDMNFSGNDDSDSDTDFSGNDNSDPDYEFSGDSSDAFEMDTDSETDLEQNNDFLSDNNFHVELEHWSDSVQKCNNHLYSGGEEGLKIPIQHIGQSLAPIDVYSSFLDEEIIALMVIETNRFFFFHAFYKTNAFTL